MQHIGRRFAAAAGPAFTLILAACADSGGGKLESAESGGGSGAPVPGPPGDASPGGGGDAPSEPGAPDASLGGDGGPGAPEGDAALAVCDPTEVLASCQVCHGPQRAEAGLDLSPPGLAERLVDVPSARCAGQRLIDPAAPERSLLLALVDARRYDPATCALGLMPPGTQGLSAPDVTCLESWVRSVAVTAGPPPAPETTAVDSSLAKVKALLTGGAPTAEERANVTADPAALRGLIEAWLETPAFEEKLRTFLQTALQQDFVGALDDQLDKPTATAASAWPGSCSARRFPTTG